MDYLSDVLTYIRRIIKSPSNASITDSLLIDYVNRFYINDVDARIQLFDLKTKYQFQTTPGVDQYNMPLYGLQTYPNPASGQATQTASFYPVYQGFMAPAYVNGVQVQFQTQKNSFFNIYPNIVQNLQAVAVGSGVQGYTFTIPIAPNNTSPVNPPIQSILRGHVDISGVIATGSATDPILSNTINTSIPTTSIYPAVYITSIDSTGANVVVSDSGQFLTGFANNGLLMQPGGYPNGGAALPGGYLNTFVITNATQATQAVLTVTSTLVAGQQVTISGVVGMTQLNGNTYIVISNTGTLLTINVNSTAFTAYVSGGVVSSSQNTINYLTGAVNVTFPVAIPPGNNINVQCYYFQSGLPRSVLFNNNTITLRNPPDRQYLVELDAYLTPAAFLSTSASIPFGYMSEYIARGAARKILSDTGDAEQLAFYEPLFREQEMLVWKRSQRQFTSTRTETIYSQGFVSGQTGVTGNGGSSL
jgi:hypothetical protein